MPLFLAAPGHGSRGPDGQGWNRLSLNAHFDVRNQCGLLPTNYAALFESMTGRQAWGGFERCNRPGPGECGACPVQRLHLEGRGIDWPAGTPLLLVRVRPLPRTPGSLFADPAAGRSTLHPQTWQGAEADVEADWQTVRNTRGIRLGRSFWDDEGEAFWLVRNNPAAASVEVRSVGRKGAARRKTIIRHELYAGPDRPLLALLTCHGGCAHSADDLQHLAADLADHGAACDPGAAPAIPPRLPGAPGIEISHDHDGSEIRRHGTITSISWHVPLDEFTVSALAAHAVRLTAS